ncbi:hypothetical protein HHL28_04165 [Aerophototrophica crusticola]|uniref:Tetratricopeptide repeat-like domain-containing protein n=1 Tax=Aerophototrophica crusticola TaxID=1709002 RepID=A0A858R5P6_9PROT|nr:hypothetical protein HHL28_04165 [Rhodospirillaceae bacterium B3]
MNRTRLFTAALLGSALSVGIMATLVPSDAFAQRAGAQKEEKKAEDPGKAPEGDAARPAVGTPLNAAQELIKQKKYKEALAKVKEADAVPNKNAYEDFLIDQIRFIASLYGGDLGVAENTFNNLEKTGRLSQQQQVQFLQALAGSYYNNKNYEKSLALIDRYFKAGGNDAQMREVQQAAKMQSGDVTGAAKQAAADVAAAEKAGKAPEEKDLRLMAHAANLSKDEAGYVLAVEKLLKYYPKKDYFQDLLIRAQKKPTFRRDRLSVDVYRLMNATGLLEKPEDYMEFAQLALQAGAPGEAQQVVEKGYQLGKLGQGADADRHKRLRDLIARSVAEDKKVLDSTAVEAANRNDGGPLVRVAEAYAGYGQYDKAIANMEKGLAKGGLKNPEDARLRLGTYYLMAGNKAKAEQTFKAVKGTDGTADLAKLWVLSGGKAV